MFTFRKKKLQVSNLNKHIKIYSIFVYKTWKKLMVFNEKIIKNRISKLRLKFFFQLSFF
jgi:hypothetical protein